MKNDPLYNLFEQKLLDDTNPNETFQDLVHNTVCEYLLNLLNEGYIPKSSEAQVEEDLKNEVIIMLRKKTYGFYELRAYREHVKRLLEKKSA